MVLMCLAGFGIIRIYENNGENRFQSESADFTVVSSFYPIYVIVENLAEGADGVVVHNLTENAVGCLHDYTLSTKDMRKLADADLFVINGLDMEPFLDDIKSVYPELPVAVSTKDIEPLETSGEHHHEEGEEEHDHDGHGEEEHDHDAIEEEHDHDSAEEHDHDGEEEHDHDGGEHHHHESEFNGHVWMDMNRYIIQVKNIEAALCEADSENAGIYRKNAELYLAKINGLKQKAETELSALRGEGVIIFHDSFAYMADELSMDIEYTLTLEDDEALSAGEIADVIEIIREHGVKYLLIEEQYGDALAKGIAGEAGVEIVCIDSLVTGDGSADSYVRGMEHNIDVLGEIINK